MMIMTTETSTIASLIMMRTMVLIVKTTQEAKNENEDMMKIMVMGIVLC